MPLQIQKHTMKSSALFLMPLPLNVPGKRLRIFYRKYFISACSGCEFASAISCGFFRHPAAKTAGSSVFLRITVRKSLVVRIFFWIPRSSRGMTETVDPAIKSRADGDCGPRDQVAEEGVIMLKLTPMSLRWNDEWKVHFLIHYSGSIKQTLCLLSMMTWVPSSALRCLRRFAIV